MAGEKARISKEIINTIDEHAQNLSELSNSKYERELEQQLENYKIGVETKLHHKISKLKEREEKKRIREESELKFGVQKKLLVKREALLSEFKLKLSEKLANFRKTDEYVDYLNEALKSVVSDNSKITVYLDSDDVDKINRSDVTVLDKVMPLGGIIIEDDNKIYDFSLQTRLEDALKEFVNESNIWI